MQPFVAIEPLFESLGKELNRSASRYELENQGHDGQYQQDVNETTHRVAAHNSDEPQYKQNHKNCPKHMSPHPKALLAYVLLE